jgi:hypothetical protein
MMRLDVWPSDVSFLLDDVTSAGAQVAEPRRACVIGAGAGRDILATLAAGASDVDAIELNEAIYEAVSSRFGRFSHDPYHLPGVHGVVSEGRNFLTRSRGDYDAITISLVDSWAAPFIRRRALADVTAAGSVYFAAIGLAFMFVELSLIQRFVLYLGHPSYATTVVLASLLAGAGLGASLAGRLTPPRLAAAVPLVPLAAAALTLVTGALIDRTLGASFATRVALAVAALAPAGAFMGLAFPAGMTTFGDRARAWHWAVNGGASVLGSVSSLALAMYFGFANVAWLGVVAYLVATLALRRAAPPLARSYASSRRRALAIAASTAVSESPSTPSVTPRVKPGGS